MPSLLAYGWGDRGSNLWGFQSLDRYANTLARPQNETFCQESAENTPPFYPAAEYSAMGLKVPAVGLIGPRQAHDGAYYAHGAPRQTLPKPAAVCKN